MLACELNWPPEGTGQPLTLQHRVRARIHVDTYGNFRFYVHMKGANLVAIPYFLQLLVSTECLGSVAVNPLLRVNRDDEP